MIYYNIKHLEVEVNSIRLPGLIKLVQQYSREPFSAAGITLTIIKNPPCRSDMMITLTPNCCEKIILVTRYLLCKLQLFCYV